MSDPGLIVDLFAGGGGASIGIEAAMGRHVDIAINHDPIAIAVHAANHPKTKHYTSDIWEVEPLEATGGRRVRLLHASPDCKHFSRAKGGKPRSQKIRSLAWVVTAWARRTRPEVITLENVPEFPTWGPLDSETGKPIPGREGETFRRWVRELERFGYVVEHRNLTASHFGAPTSRKRFFLIARRDGQPIRWPERTHGPGLLPYRTAAECIDWSIPCPSIFERKKPLAVKTLRRIAAGVVRFVLQNPKPFIVKVNHGGDKRRPESLDEPLTTVTASQRGHAVVTPTVVPFVAGCGGRAGQTPPTPGDAPLGTITTKNDRVLVAPALIQTSYGERKGQAPRVLDLHQPLGTVVAQGQKHSLVAAFLSQHYQGQIGHELTKPIPTITAVDHHALTTSSLMVLRNNCDAKGLDEPLPTVCANGNHLAEIRAFLIAYYGEGSGLTGHSLAEPLPTVPTHDRFGLVTVDVEGVTYAIADIGMRMLEPHELNRAQFGRFSAGYDASAAKTKKDRVRLTGNSVAPEVEEAVIKALFPDELAKRVA